MTYYEWHEPDCPDAKGQTGVWHTTWLALHDDGFPALTVGCMTCHRAVKVEGGSVTINFRTSLDNYSRSLDDAIESGILRPQP